jgi:hypothetical protein
MTNQEAFDTVKAHLLKQNKRAQTEPGNACKYRVGELKCAVGCLIPDNIYQPEMEGKVVGELRHLDCLQGLDFALLKDLQYCHDNVEVAGWPVYLSKVAIRFNLKD